MKKISLIILLFPIFSFGQSSEKVLTEEEIKKMLDIEAKPVYVKAQTTILQLQSEVDLAKNKKIDSRLVVKHYNALVGNVMGKRTNLTAVDKRLKEAGDAYVQVLFLKEKARIAFKKAAEAKFESEHIND